MSATINYDITSPLELLYDSDYIHGIIVYKGSNPIDYYPYNLQLNELVGLFNLFATDRLDSVTDYIIVRISGYYVLIIPLTDYKSLTIIFKPNTSLKFVEKYYDGIASVLSKLFDVSYKN